jgi:predicted ATP-dependent endonuclease of OLD family
LNPIYTDLHIHTSNDSNNLNAKYDINKLISKIKEYAKSNDLLISLTDHNRINKNAYINLQEKVKFLVGVELHIRNFDECIPYHCHVYFNLTDKDLSNEIDKLNKLLMKLYPNPMPSNLDIIPKIFDVVNEFNDYDFLVLPHGGQSHSTFDMSIPNNLEFDTAMEKTIYYNLFDGFTSRSNIGLDKTLSYFERLGISEFVNLVTCTDNYNLNRYPLDKNSNDNFVPTWIYASPTFDGLRIALSEKTRLYYGLTPTQNYQESISACELRNDRIDISVKFSDGLNVVIGNSSSGKTLLVDSVYNKINKNDFAHSVYDKDYSVSDIEVTNHSNITPHYFNQNYILEMTKSKSSELENIEILKRVFPQDKDVIRRSDANLTSLKKDIDTLINTVEQIERIQNSIRAIPSFVRLITFGENMLNVLSAFKIDQTQKNRLDYSQEDYDEDIARLDTLVSRQKSLYFFDDISKEVESILYKIKLSRKMILFENTIREIIEKHIKAIESDMSNQDKEKASKELSRASLIAYIADYKKQLDTFYSILKKISTQYNYRIQTKEITSSGHILFIENNLTITKEIVLESINEIRNAPHKIRTFEDLSATKLFKSEFSQKSPKIDSYDIIKSKIVEFISKSNKVIYKIKYKAVKDFDDLSPGLKTSVILDLILGYEEDSAPLIIDQPEDNLATNYLNHGLIDGLKRSKSKRQLIVVTHNATIPMLADANNVIVCTNKDNKITISSHLLEDSLHGVKITDKIAELTDGGKTSIKKRFKKYNLKNFKGDENNADSD